MADQNPLRRRSPLQLMALMAIASTGGIGFGGSGRPDFAPGPAMPEPRRALPAAPPAPEPPKRQHQPVFTAAQKAKRAKRKAERAKRKAGRR